VLRLKRKLGVTRAEVSGGNITERASAALRPMISLDPGMDFPDPSAQIDTERAELRITLAALLLTLTPHQRAVMIARTGLDGNGGATLESVGTRFNLTR